MFKKHIEKYLGTFFAFILLGGASIQFWNFSFIDMPFHVGIINKDRTATILFGITAGVLSLVGLLSIFISLSFQHRLEKTRELYWDMVNLPFEGINTENTIKRMTQHIRQFRKIRGGTDLFTHIVTKVSLFTILFVCLIWSVYVGLVVELGLEGFLIIISTILAIIILLYFFNILRQISHIDRISDLPKLSNMLDAHKEEDLLATQFLPMSTHLAFIGYFPELEGQAYQTSPTNMLKGNYYSEGQTLTLFIEIPVNHINVRIIRLVKQGRRKELYNGGIHLTRTIINFEESQFNGFVKEWEQHGKGLAVHLPVKPDWLSKEDKGYEIALMFSAFDLPSYIVELEYKKTKEDSLMLVKRSIIPVNEEGELEEKI
ncbi:hypothetical protein ACFYKX_14055 [Cytobacillus sp. FJAT-54145]|uniref:Uncharacterized protein n=1 Tax=Cytobacillus spartinae TaxID=3299023 RepID=A0ABW6KD98_9BACI